MFGFEPDMCLYIFPHTKFETLMNVVPTEYTTLSRHQTNVDDFDLTAQQRRLPSGCIVEREVDVNVQNINQH